MVARKIYEKLQLKLPSVEQRRFFNWLNDTINELRIMFGDENHIFINSDEVSEVTSLDDEINIKDLYAGAIVDNLLFLGGLGDGYKGEFVRKAELAYNRYWSTGSKRKIQRRLRW